jgi:uncharacterized protein YkwD
MLEKDRAFEYRSQIVKNPGAHVVVVSMLAAVLTINAQLWSPMAVEAVAAAPAVFVPVQPCRLADTRPEGGQTYTRIDPLTISVATKGRCAIPAGATSVALTLTVVQPSGPGFLTAWPGDQTLPTVSNVNFQAGQTRANGSITKVDGSGTVRVYTSVPAFVVVDVVGAFVTSGATAVVGRFVPRPSARLFDSRASVIVAAGGSVTIPVPAGVPGDAIALALNLTVTESSLPGFVTAFAAGKPRPVASVLNLDRARQTRAAGGIFPMSSAGITLFLSGGGHVIVDFSGYFTGPSSGGGTDGLFTAVDPTRLLDTRGPSPLGVGVPIYPGGGVELAVAHTGSMAYNVTSVDGDPGFIRAYSAGTPQPATSTLNPQGQGDVVANFAVTQTSDRGFDYFSQPQTNLIVDLQGWFSGASVASSLPPPANIAPPPPTSAISPCRHDGLNRINAERAKVGARQLTVNPAAEAFACSWALHLAQLAGGISHSDSATRDAAVGCPAGENVAYTTGTTASTPADVSKLMDMWMASAPHHTNIINSIYVGAGLGYVTRTDASGGTRTYGVTTFALC